MHHVVEMLKILLIILKLSDTFVNVCHWIEMGTIISLTKSTNTLLMFCIITTLLLGTSDSLDI